MAFDPVLPRRRFLAYSGAAGGALALPQPGLAAAARPGERPDRLPEGNRIVFSVLLNGEDPIGEHRWDFKPNGREIDVTIDVKLEVTFAFITAFKYEHHNEVRWRRGRMVSLESETLDNGNKDRVSVTRKNGALVVDGRGEPYRAPLDLMPATYWRYATVDCTSLLNTQTGKTKDIRFEKGPAETVETDLGSFDTRKWKMRGDIEIDLWYTAQGDLIRIAFTRQGRRIVYRLTEGGPGRRYRWGKA